MEDCWLEGQKITSLNPRLRTTLKVLKKSEPCRLHFANGWAFARLRWPHVNSNPISSNNVKILSSMSLQNMLTLKSRSGCQRWTIPRIWDLTKIQCGIWKMLTEYVIWLLTGKRDSPKLGMDAGLGRKTIFGIAMTEVWDAGFSWKKNRKVGLGPPSQNLVGVTWHKHSNLSSVCGD